MNICIFISKYVQFLVQLVQLACFLSTYGLISGVDMSALHKRFHAIGSP